MIEEESHPKNGISCKGKVMRQLYAGDDHEGSGDPYGTRLQSPVKIEEQQRKKNIKQCDEYLHDDF
jgi:hypothetical protein